MSDPFNQMPDGWYCSGDAYYVQQGVRVSIVGGFMAGPFSDMETAQKAVKCGGRSIDDLAAALARVEAAETQLAGERSVWIETTETHAYEKRKLMERAELAEARVAALIAAGNALASTIQPQGNPLAWEDLIDWEKAKETNCVRSNG